AVRQLARRRRNKQGMKFSIRMVLDPGQATIRLIDVIDVDQHLPDARRKLLAKPLNRDLLAKLLGPLEHRLGKHVRCFLGWNRRREDGEVGAVNEASSMSPRRRHRAYEEN